ncbi:MAG: hypothetical protein ACRESC_06330, partial [Gammaproteobacteria bacterium]
GLYNFPVYFTEKAQNLVIDFGKNRDGFVLMKFGDKDRSVLDFMANIIEPPPVDRPPQDALLKLVRREYPGFLAKDKNNKGK